MTFEDQYLDYDTYLELGGSDIGEMPFNILEFEARRKIDEKTFNRLKNVDSENIPQEVKMCEFNLINTIKGYIKTDSSGNVVNTNVVSENTDGYSVSYVSPALIKEVVSSKNTELDNIIETYLFGVFANGEHLIYIGMK